jgi:biopolymer transport protein ExbD
MITRKISHKILGIDPSTIANIAFLLVGLFLVMAATRIEAGINTTLPIWQPPIDINDWHFGQRRNLFDISINSIDKIIIRNEDKEYTDIKKMLIEFVTNNGKSEIYSERPEVVVVSLKNDNGTSYAMYIKVYDEIKAAYKSIWDTAAQKKYNRFYHQLTKQEQNEILTRYPLTISEAELRYK